MKKILLILLLIPFISFGQTDTVIKTDTIEKYKFLEKLKTFKKYVSISRNLSFVQKNYSQLEFGIWKPDNIMRFAITLDNSQGEKIFGNYWIGTKFYFEVSDTEKHCFFLYLHPKINNYTTSLRLNYGFAYIPNKNKILHPMISLNFENTDFILSV